jgi:hypothetical protein
VSGPSCVSNPGVRNKSVVEINTALFDQLLQLSDLANLLVSENLALLVAIYGNTGGVVATVFESRKTYIGAGKRQLGWSKFFFFCANPCKKSVRRLATHRSPRYPR